VLTHLVAGLVLTSLLVLKMQKYFILFFFHNHTVHLDTISVLLPTDAQNNCSKRILKFTLKQLQLF